MKGSSSPGAAASILGIIDQTDHSIIQLMDWNEQKVVVKRCRHPADPKSTSRWRREVDALLAAGAHVGMEPSSVCKISLWVID
jgi:hypothetical protein